MCGITGIIHLSKDRFVSEEILARMTSVLQHRGPDGEGLFIHRNVGLGHRRLSIIDLHSGDQPMISADRNKIIVFNGEIYNYLELRDQLIKKGHTFHTESDTEVILKSYEEWGHDCQSRFNGMWAFAIYDKLKDELFISRDRIGEKPLFYAVYDNTFLIGSELKSIFAYGVPKEPDLSLVEIYLTMTNVPEPYSFYKGIKKLKAGHFIVLKNGVYREYKYWDLPDIDESDMERDKNLIYSKFEEIFRDSVRIRMRSDVPFGAFLSGGLDSSSVVSVMSEVSNLPINTFTIGFPQKDFDESLLAKSVAKKFGTHHYQGTVKPDDFEDIVERVFFHYDEPFGDSSAIPTGYVSKFARERVKMVLTGDGGDEVLSGYNSYVGIKISNLYRKNPEWIQSSIPHVIAGIKKFTKGPIRLKLNRMQSVSETSQLEFNERILSKKPYAPLSFIKKLTKDIDHIYPVEDFFGDFMGQCGYKDDFYKMMFLNFKYDLPNDYLVKVDRMSMAYSLETRVPFLDYRLIEFMCSVDKSIKLQGWERKSVLRHTIGKTLPKEIMGAPKKGFGIPLREWFKQGDFSPILENNLGILKEIMNPSVIDMIIKDNNSSLSDHGNFIWTMLMLNRNLM